jgi:hypothetical protein
MKVLLIPVAILAFIIFLIVLGAIGLGVSFVVIAVVGRIWRLISWPGRAISKGARRQRT